jgi:hypothetical protein
MLLERRLVRQQPIQRAVQTIVINAFAGYSEQIFQRGSAIPSFSDV